MSIPRDVALKNATKNYMSACDEKVSAESKVNVLIEQLRVARENLKKKEQEERISYEKLQDAIDAYRNGDAITRRTASDSCRSTPESEFSATPPLYTSHPLIERAERAIAQIDEM